MKIAILGAGGLFWGRVVCFGGGRAAAGGVDDDDDDDKSMEVRERRVVPARSFALMSRKSTLTSQVGRNGSAENT